MVSRENRVIAACVVAALVLSFLLGALTPLDDRVLLAVLLGVGVLAPLAVNGYLDDLRPE
ncbi:hypothetical protein ACOZ4I_02150 [Haloarcula salina]|uniref:hypothetical protein n=1 Tax=Haloarcula salina TaxID=1429914 RepID=UPI003C6F81C3